MKTSTCREGWCESVVVLFPSSLVGFFRVPSLHALVFILFVTCMYKLHIELDTVMLQPCVSNTLRCYVSGHGFNCFISTFAYSVCYENKIIINGDTEIMPRTSFHSYNMTFANVVVYKHPPLFLVQ